VIRADLVSDFVRPKLRNYTSQAHQVTIQSDQTEKRKRLVMVSRM